GFEHVSLLVLPRWGHVNPSGTWLARGIDALEHSSAHKPPTTAPTKDPNPQPGQVAVARRWLSTAQWYLKFRMSKDAAPYLRKVVEDYPTTPSAAIAKELLEKLPVSTTAPSKRR